MSCGSGAKCLTSQRPREQPGAGGSSIGKTPVYEGPQGSKAVLQRGRGGASSPPCAR